MHLVLTLVVTALRFFPLLLPVLLLLSFLSCISDDNCTVILILPKVTCSYAKSRFISTR